MMRSPFDFDPGTRTLLTQGEVRKRIAREAGGGKVARRTFDHWVARKEFPGPTKIERRGYRGSARLWSPEDVERGILNILRAKSAPRGVLVERLGHATMHKAEIRDLGRLAYDLARAGVLRDALTRIGCNVPLKDIPRGHRALARAALLQALAMHGM